MKTILIVWMMTGGSNQDYALAIDHIPFTTEAACETASQAMRSKQNGLYGPYINTICVAPS